MFARVAALASNVSLVSIVYNTTVPRSTTDTTIVLLLQVDLATHLSDLETYVFFGIFSEVDHSLITNSPLQQVDMHLYGLDLVTGIHSDSFPKRDSRSGDEETPLPSSQAEDKKGVGHPYKSKRSGHVGLARLLQVKETESHCPNLLDPADQALSRPNLPTTNPDLIQIFIKNLQGRIVYM